MGDDGVLPRVNFESMQRFQGRKVLLLGEVKPADGPPGTVALRTADDAEVTVQTSPAGSVSWNETPFVEVVCQVLDARTVREESHINIRGPAVDLRLYNEMVKLSSNKYRHLFAP